MEGIVIIGGLFFDEIVTDFAILMEVGWSAIWVSLLGFILILVGGCLSYEIWILHGIHRDSSRKFLFLFNSQYFMYPLVGVLICQILLPIELRSVKEFLAICMVLHWIYLGIRIYLAPRILPVLTNNSAQYTNISIQSSIFSLFLGCGSWVFSFFIF